jgi:hypothetical protein
MHIARTYFLPESDNTHIRVYDCPACHHELRLTVWDAEQKMIRGRRRQFGLRPTADRADWDRHFRLP